MNLNKLKCTVGKLEFNNPLVYGGGTLKTLDDVKNMCRSEAAGGEVGTITPLSREGNYGDVFYAHRVNGVLIFTLNSLGLNNSGKDAVTLWAKEAIKRAHDAGKLLGVNVSADTFEEMVDMVLWGIECGFDWVTINAGCPNKWKLVGDIQVPQAILSFDTGDTWRLMDALEIRVSGCETEVWWKPSPDSNTLGTQIDHAKIVAQSTVITAWIANNTEPHCYAWDYENGRLAISPGGGLAGMGGPAVKPKALGDLTRLGSRLPEKMNLIGAGGVTYGSDILDYMRVGASITHFSSAHWASHFDFNVPGNMLAEFCEMPEAEAFLEAA